MIDWSIFIIDRSLSRKGSPKLSSTSRPSWRGATWKKTTPTCLLWLLPPCGTNCSLLINSHVISRHVWWFFPFFFSNHLGWSSFPLFSFWFARSDSCKYARLRKFVEDRTIGAKRALYGRKRVISGGFPDARIFRTVGREKLQGTGTVKKKNGKFHDA